MRALYLIIIIPFLLVSCNKNDDNANNGYIPNIAFDTGSLINTNLPQYSHMELAGNHVVLNQPYGLNGVVVFYAGGDTYSAFELTDPNHQINSCSKLTVDGIIATCSCTDDNSYDIVTGLGQEGTPGPFVLRRYFVEVVGNIIRVYNN